jgi:hypothetical protein
MHSRRIKFYFYTQGFLMKKDKLLAHGWWFSLGTPASSTTKTGGHDIAEILLKVALNTINKINCYDKTTHIYFPTSSYDKMCHAFAAILDFRSAQTSHIVQKTTQ